MRAVWALIVVAAAGCNNSDNSPSSGLGATALGISSSDSMLKPEEVEDMYARSSSRTARCWAHAQKQGTYPDLKRVVVTLTVAPGGGVDDVSFAGLPQDDSGNLGPCLSSMIKSWKFRTTREGLTSRITMAFQ